MSMLTCLEIPQSRCGGFEDDSVVNTTILMHQNVSEALHRSERLQYFRSEYLRLLDLGKHVIFLGRQAEPEPRHKEVADIKETLYRDLQQPFACPACFHFGQVFGKAGRHDLTELSEVSIEFVDLGQNSVTIQHGPRVPDSRDRMV